MKKILVASLVAALWGCDDALTGVLPPPDEVTIVTTGTNRFSPASVELAVGGTASWSFNSIGHTVVFDDVAGKPANIGLTVSQTEDRTFSSAGTFTYHCTVHTNPPMTGTVIVR